MGWTITQFQDTPNPNAMKCVLDRAIATTPRSYANAAAAAEDAIAQRLFAVPGVTNLLIHPTWITVNKTPETAWKTLKAGISKALSEISE